MKSKFRNWESIWYDTLVKYGPDDSWIVKTQWGYVLVWNDGNNLNYEPIHANSFKALQRWSIIEKVDDCWRIREDCYKSCKGIE